MHNKANDEEKTEPKEHDKWMENNEHEKDSELNPKTSRLDGLRGRAKQFASNKYHVIIALLCVVLFILFLIVIVLAVRLGTYTCLRSTECRTAECLRSASLVVQRADFTADPCEDFWSYSCKGWVNSNPITANEGSHSVTDNIKQVIYSRIRHLIDLVPHDAEVGSHQIKVKQFYSTCMNMENNEYWVPGKITEAIHTIGGWAIIKDPPSLTWNNQEVLKKLHVKYGVSPFFKILVEADDLNPTRNIIKLVPGGLGLPNRRYYTKSYDDLYAKAYKNFIRNTLNQMDVTLHDAGKLADDLFRYEARIAEATPSDEDLRNTKKSYIVLRVRELDRLSTSVSWTSLLQALFPDAVHPETEVAILSEQYFREISRIISSTTNNLLNDYFMWQFVRSYVPYSSSKFRLIANHFQQTLEGVPDLHLKAKENWIQCIDLTSHFLGHAVGTMYVQKYFPDDMIEKIQPQFNKLVSALNTVSNDLRWLNDRETSDLAHLKIRSMMLLVGHPNFARNQTIGSYYQDLMVQTDLFENIIKGVSFSHKKQQEKLKKNSLTDYSWSVHPHSIEADYKYAGNQLVIPAGIFENPYLEIRSPLPMKYGALAAHIGDKLAKIFDDKGINYDTYGSFSPWMSNNSVTAFRRKEDCLENFVFNYSLHGVMVENKAILSSLIAEIGGVKIAYEAFRRDLEKNSEGTLPGTDIEDKQLFFLSYAQSLCETVRMEKLQATNDARTALPAQLRVLSTLQQMPEFSSAFSCQQYSKMSSARQCYMW